MTRKRKSMLALLITAVVLVTSFTLYNWFTKEKLPTLDACVIAGYENTALVYAKQDGADEVYWVLGDISCETSKVKIMDANGKPYRDALKPGQMICFSFPGLVQETYPAGFVGVTEIRLLDSYEPTPETIYQQGLQEYQNLLTLFDDDHGHDD